MKFIKPVANMRLDKEKCVIIINDDATVVTNPVEGEGAIHYTMYDAHGNAIMSGDYNYREYEKRTGRYTGELLNEPTILEFVMFFFDDPGINAVAAFDELLVAVD